MSTCAKKHVMNLPVKKKNNIMLAGIKGDTSLNKCQITKIKFLLNVYRNYIECIKYTGNTDKIYILM